MRRDSSFGLAVGDVLDLAPSAEASETLTVDEWAAHARRPARADDRFLFGSVCRSGARTRDEPIGGFICRDSRLRPPCRDPQATKPITAVAVLRLKEAGALALSDPVALHVDGLLADNFGGGTSLASLFGPHAADATVGQLLSMEASLAAVL